MMNAATRLQTAPGHNEDEPELHDDLREEEPEDREAHPDQRSDDPGQCEDHLDLREEERDAERKLDNRAGRGRRRAG